MRLRKGTHSCLSCRHRKVRCWYSSPQGSVCVHCARRKTACIPQGNFRHDSAQGPVPRLYTNIAYDQNLDPFFRALHKLRHRVEDSLRATAASHADSQRTPSEPLLDPETVQNSCAPVIKLLGHSLINQRTKPPHYQADQQAMNPGCSAHLGYCSKSLQPATHPLVLHEMCAVLPPDSEIADILTSRSQWWGLWRRSFGLTWGEREDDTLTKFATRAVGTTSPALLGSLLLCFSLSTGNHSRYISPVESWVLAHDFRTAHKYDFQCIMGLGLCLMSAIQLLRAWAVYRKTNVLLQLAGIHRSHRRSEPLDLVFWQLFSADRWVSLLTGLPYSVPGNLCYVSIPPITQLDPVTYHHRHLTLLTGQVIDCLQSPMGSSFTTVIGVDEEIDKITAHLPDNYLSIPHIIACPDADERNARFYRIAEVSQLKTFLYLPFFLKYCDAHKQQLCQLQSAWHGRTVCLSSARCLIEVYLALYDMDSATAIMDNSMKLTSFTALTAAVVLLLDILAGDHSTRGSITNPSASTTPRSDTALISRTAAVFEACSEGQSQSLCGQCHSALVSLMSCCQTLGRGESRAIAVPYFGVVEISRKEDTASTHPHVTQPTIHDENVQPISITLDPPMSSFNLDDPYNVVFQELTIGDDIFFSYHGPWETHQREPYWPGGFAEASGSSSNENSSPYYSTEFPV